MCVISSVSGLKNENSNNYQSKHCEAEKVVAHLHINTQWHQIRGTTIQVNRHNDKIQLCIVPKGKEEYTVKYHKDVDISPCATLGCVAGTSVLTSL